MRKFGWTGSVLAAALPLLAFFFLRTVDSVDVAFGTPTGHFYIVSAVALLSTGIAIAVGVSGSRLRDVKVSFPSLAFVSLAELFAIHGLSTPHLLMHSTRLTGVSAQLSVLLASFWLWMSTLASDPRKNRDFLHFAVYIDVPANLPVHLGLITGLGFKPLHCGGLFWRPMRLYIVLDDRNATGITLLFQQTQQHFTVKDSLC